MGLWPSQFSTTCFTKLTDFLVMTDIPLFAFCLKIGLKLLSPPASPNRWHAPCTTERLGANLVIDQCIRKDLVLHNINCLLGTHRGEGPYLLIFCVTGLIFKQFHSPGPFSTPAPVSESSPITSGLRGHHHHASTLGCLAGFLH